MGGAPSCGGGGAGGGGTNGSGGNSGGTLTNLVRCNNITITKKGKNSYLNTIINMIQPFSGGKTPDVIKDAILNYAGIYIDIPSD